MSDDEQHLVITEQQLLAILTAAPKDATPEQIVEAVADQSLRTSLSDGAVVPPVLDVLGEVAHQLSRIADTAQKPRPTLTEEFVIDSWESTIGPFYQEKALPFLAKLQVDVEIEPTHRV